MLVEDRPVHGKGLPMAEADPRLLAGTKLGQLFSRAWSTWKTPTTPDYSVETPTDGHELWLRQLERVRYALEQARQVIVTDGWTSGAWFTVAKPAGGARHATTYEAFGLCGPQASVVSACLVGTLLRMADDPDQVPTIADVWGCVDELYEAVHEQAGHASFPPGRAYPHVERRARLRGLTAWNDEPGRRKEHVVDVIDRAIARTIVAACN
jgi:hypothetical protein